MSRRGGIIINNIGWGGRRYWICVVVGSRRWCIRRSARSRRTRCRSSENPWTSQNTYGFICKIVKQSPWKIESSIGTSWTLKFFVNLWRMAVVNLIAIYQVCNLSIGSFTIRSDGNCLEAICSRCTATPLLWYMSIKKKTYTYTKQHIQQYSKPRSKQKDVNPITPSKKKRATHKIRIRIRYSTSSQTSIIKRKPGTIKSLLYNHRHSSSSSSSSSQ